MSDFDIQQEQLNFCVAETYRSLSNMEAAGMSYDEAQAVIVESFLAAAREQGSALAGATHYALACCRLALASAAIAALQEKIDMRDAVINDLKEIEEL